MHSERPSEVCRIPNHTSGCVGVSDTLSSFVLPLPNEADAGPKLAVVSRPTSFLSSGENMNRTHMTTIGHTSTLRYSNMSFALSIIFPARYVSIAPYLVYCQLSGGVARELHRHSSEPKSLTISHTSLPIVKTSPVLSYPVNLAVYPDTSPPYSTLTEPPPETP